MKHFIFVIWSLVTTTSCGQGIPQLNHSGMCDGYPVWTTSQYELPWALGEEFEAGQGNCGGLSHIGIKRYAYDIRMPINSQIVAARAGTVIKIVEDRSDGNGCAKGANYMDVLHADGTVASYLHLTKNGAQVVVGAAVNQGDNIALSGNTGCSSGPHLHFEVSIDREKSDTMAVTFSNTSKNVRGLQEGKSYTAQ